ncbi:unnamed protein product, partial [Callosobruchus maculatus]
VSAKKWVSV